MLKKTLPLAFLTFLTACGGGGGSNAPHPDNQLFEKFKGNELEPTLTDMSGKVINDTLPINSIVNDSITFLEPKTWTFTANKTGKVLFQIDTSNNGGDFYVSGPNVDLSMSARQSKNPIIFDAIQDQTYDLRLTWNSWISPDPQPSPGSEQSFTLKLVEANRASIDLADDEYAFSLQVNTSDSCDFEGNEKEVTSNYLDTGILNPTAAYIDTVSRHKRFDYVQEAMGSFRYTPTGNNYYDSFLLNINSETGVITEFAEGTYIHPTSNIECSSQYHATGKILF